MSGSPTAGAGDDRRQRLRDQMKAFYGDPNASAKRAAAQAASAAGAASNLPPELDLDSEYFNVNRYTTDLLKRESLKGLVETDTELLRRVRKLDGELQELVYRNYARFISATDTIREMKDSVVEMDTKLQTLSHNVNAIDGISSEISQQLQVHRSHIEETITANRMLKKVQFLTSLPTTMRRLIDKEEFNVGVKYWVAGDGFLTKHKSIASITQIQLSCCQLAKELYSAIEQRMCSYPLDDPDAMDRIRGYVEDLRLLRATSLFESAHMADQPPFEESVLQTLMTSVTQSFHANVATTQRSLKAALLIPEDICTMDLAKREASLSQVNLREPLAQLKNACAMLAVNSQRVYALLDASAGTAGESEERSSAAAQAAKDIQPVLMDVLPPLTQSLTDFTLAHLDAIAMDGGSAMRDAAASAEAIQSATTHFARLLKQVVTALKTLGEIYLTPLATAPAATSPRSQSPRHHSSTGSGAAAVAAGRRASAAMGSPVTRDTAVHRYAVAVHEAAQSVLQQCHRHLCSKILQQPDGTTLQACVPLPLANASVVLSAVPAADEGRTLQLAFVHTRLLYASLSQCVAAVVRSIVASEDGLPLDAVSTLMAQFERTAQQLQHRGIVLLGQLEVQSVYAAAFSGNSSGHDVGHAEKNVPAVQPVLLQLLPEWATVYETVKALPPVTPAHPSTTTANTNSAIQRREVSQAFSGGPASSSGLGGSNRGGAYGGAGGSSTGALSDHRHPYSPSNNNNNNATGTGGSAAHHRGSSGKLAVAFTRQVMSALQLSVNNIFANTETALRTSYAGGPPSAIMGCVVRYVLQGIVDLVREEVSYTEAQFQRLHLSCTFLLYALLSPAKGSAPRQWRKEWADSDHQAVQRLLDEACSCAYDRYEGKVPLSAAVLEKVVEAAVKGGRAAAATTTTMVGPLNDAENVETTAATTTTTTTTPAAGSVPPATSGGGSVPPSTTTVDFAEDAMPPISASQRTAMELNAAAAAAVTAAAPPPSAPPAAPAPTPAPRHDDPLQTPSPSSYVESAPATLPPPPPAPARTAVAFKSAPAPAAVASVSAQPPAAPSAGPTATSPKLSAPPSAVSPSRLPAPSAPAAKPAAVGGSQYYGGGAASAGRQSERVSRVDDDEELPM